MCLELLLFGIWGGGLASVCSLGCEVFQITEWLVRRGCCVGGCYVMKYRCEDCRQKS